MTMLNISIAERQPATMAKLEEILAFFGAERQVTIDAQVLAWEEMWTGLRAVALHHEGPAMSEVGSTWVGSFVGMNALRQFSPTEVAQIVPADNIVPAAWQTASFRGNKQVWSIPWLVDSRVVLYWRDMLEDAGIDEETAFVTPEHMEETFERLTASGIETPWGEGTEIYSNTVYHAASWVWAKGGDYISDDGRHTCLDTPEVLAGLRDYFGLYRFMPHTGELITAVPALERFAERRAAAAISGSWSLMTILRNNPSAVDTLGVTLPPGPPFIGGTNLMVWRHVPPRAEGLVMDLLRMLMSYDAQHELSAVSLGGLLPSRLDVLNEMRDFTFPQSQMFVDAIKVGRSMPSISIWSIVEERLAAAFRHIWTTIIQNPDQSIADIIASQLEPLSRRLDRSLAQVQH